MLELPLNRHETVAELCLCFHQQLKKADWEGVAEKILVRIVLYCCLLRSGV